jgi:ornithine decarboxylase
MSLPDRLNDEQIQAIASQHGTPVLVLDCDVLRSQFHSLQHALPKVEFYYAVKAFPHASIVKTLDQCGASFDIASTGETELLRSLYVNPRKSIHTHPIKKDRDIRDAMRFGCTTFVVDNLDEVKKFRKYRNRVALLVRVSFRSADAIVDLSRKFGCSPDEVPQLLQRAEDMGIRVKGLSFHVGSQSQKPDAHVGAIRRCGDIIKKWDQFSSIPMSILDIGGGFPVDYKLDGKSAVDIDAYCAPIREALKAVPEDIHVIAEPGRFLVGPAATAIGQVVGKAERGGQTWYYLDDGVYNSYSGRIYDHAQYPIRVLKEKLGATKACVLAGPTCDSIDVIEEAIELPELEIGDLIIGEVMGAYTAATATEFNSLPKSKIVVLNENASGKVSRVA